MQLMRCFDGIGFGWGSELRIAAQILLCLIVLGSVILSPGKAGPYAGLFNALYSPLYERLTSGSMAAAQVALAMFVTPFALAMLSA